LNVRKCRFDFRRQRRLDVGSRCVLACCFMLGLAASSGCRGKAYRDVYQQKMIGEIRNLEDQLYEADYQNKILVDELARTRSQIVVPDTRRSRSPGQNGATTPRPGTSPSTSSATPVPLDPQRPQPILPARPIPPSSDDLTPPPASRPGTPQNRSFEPPLVPIPPGAEMEFPDVDLGEPVPPAGINAMPELPPGRIELPDATRRNVRVQPAEPVAIRINPAMSGGHRFDDSDTKTGMHLAIEAIDERGDLVRLEDFDVAAQLSIVLLDPTLPTAEARLGRWDYDIGQIRKMIRPGQNSAIHVYIAWNEKQPSGKQVIAHVKLTGDQTQMQAQADLNTADVNVAQWNPRSGQMR